jgi:hypothetical protein
MSSETDALRERSGTIKINSKLVSFLYELMRDYLPAGEVESIVRNSQEPDCTYTNGWLAKYAEDLANRLTTEEK